MHFFPTKVSQLAFLAACLLSGCTAPISVHQSDPPPSPHSSLQAKVDAFRELSRHDPQAAAGRLLDGIRACQNRIKKGEAGAVEDYNYLVSRFIEQLEKAHIEPWDTTIQISGNSTTYQLSGLEPPDLDARDRELVPTDTLTFTGDYALTDRVIRPGIGAPLVAVMPGKTDFTAKLPAFESHYRSVTALVSVEGSKATVQLMDPIRKETLDFIGKDRPLTADYSSMVSLALSRERVDKLGLVRMLNPQRYASTARLAFVQPYDPKRIPILLVHGLQDTPATWLPMYLGLIQDPYIREHYQFWTFSYPSGYPFLYSASILRKELDRVDRDHPDHKKIVIVGHSMGGIISRMMVTDAGEQLWRELFGKAPAETKISGRNRKLLEEALIFNARPDIARAVFICAPHRGSDLASNWIGRLSARLIRAPTLITDVASSAFRIATLDPAGMQLGRAPNSIDTLSPNNRSVRATAKLQIRNSIPFHSLMGDRDKCNTPNSSDGVVAYWSSHLDGAASEKIVPCNHSSHQNPVAIAEVARILHLHAGKSE